MINWISSWAKGIALAVIMATIIEMILPENSNKKYIKMVIGVYILFAILSPIITAIKGRDYEFEIADYEKYFKNTYKMSSGEISKNNDEKIVKIYKDNMKKDITQKIKNRGYKVKSISIDIKTEGENYGNLERIVLQIEKENLKQVNSVSIKKIEVSNSSNTNSNETSNLNSSEIKEIKQYLSDTYDVEKNNIEIN